MSAAASSSSSSTATVGQSDQTGIIKDGWFMEINSQWPGIANSIEIEEKLLDEKTKYQSIMVFKSKSLGNVLILDGVIQLTEKDESSYQEMMAHLPMFAHHQPEHVLVIGGGDGGVIRELVKHDTLKQVIICEIDQGVIDAGKKYFPSVASAWDDERVKLHVGDGNAFMKLPENEGKFDVIITDSSDPVGPAQTLFESPFYQAMAKALKPGGKVCTQAECYWKDLPLIKKLVKESRHIYDNVEYASTQTPTYPYGQIGFLICSKAPAAKAHARKKPSGKDPRPIPSDMLDKLKYYTTALHNAAFALPKFVEEAVNEAVEEAETEIAAKLPKKEAKSSSKKSSSSKKGAKGKRKGSAADDKEDEEDSSASSASSKSAKTDDAEDSKDTDVKDA